MVIHHQLNYTHIYFFPLVSLGAPLRAETGNCGRFCPTVYEPLCATDGRTYGNTNTGVVMGLSFAYNVLQLKNITQIHK